MKSLEEPVCVQSHNDDILCMDFYILSNGTVIVASSSYDGEINIWSLEIGEKKEYLK